ncbi:uncharacterized protein isoform X2 [Danio rerio]|uniref:Uncharacterized protein isoform X2 n=3 Tax=Danio rerio TaxID=7955 RepID=A0AC58I106_DANRE
MEKPNSSTFQPSICARNRGHFGHVQWNTRATAHRIPTRIDQISRELQRLGLDACFIQTVTLTEVFCGKKRYKCSGCLRYYEDLECLMAHIMQGWKEGYSCRVFYRKLKDMKDCQVLLTMYEEEPSEFEPQLSGSSILIPNTRNEKLDMVLRPFHRSSPNKQCFTRSLGLIYLPSCTATPSCVSAFVDSTCGFASKEPYLQRRQKPNLLELRAERADGERCVAWAGWMQG